MRSSGGSGASTATGAGAASIAVSAGNQLGAAAAEGEPTVPCKSFMIGALQRARETVNRCALKMRYTNADTPLSEQPAQWTSEPESESLASVLQPLAPRFHAFFCCGIWGSPKLTAFAAAFGQPKKR